MSTFGEILESVAALPREDQENLVSILERRLREQRRAELTEGVKNARQQFKTGRIKRASVASIVKRITS